MNTSCNIPHLAPDVRDFRQTPLLKSRDLPNACTSLVLEQNDTHFVYDSCIGTRQCTRRAGGRGTRMIMSDREAIFHMVSSAGCWPSVSSGGLLMGNVLPTCNSDEAILLVNFQGV